MSLTGQLSNVVRNTYTWQPKTRLSLYDSGEGEISNRVEMPNSSK